jgi:hypothetical protein
MMHLATQNNWTTDGGYGSVRDINACSRRRQLSPKADIAPPGGGTGPAVNPPRAPKAMRSGGCPRDAAGSQRDGIELVAVRPAEIQPPMASRRGLMGGL